MELRNTLRKQRIHSAGLLVLSLGLSSYAASSSNSGIQGAVTDSETKKPISGVKVCTTPGHAPLPLRRGVSKAESGWE
jgi:hypothetical protein